MHNCFFNFDEIDSIPSKENGQFAGLMEAPPADSPKPHGTAEESSAQETHSIFNSAFWQKW